jgi:hypothetical protein
MFFYIEDSTKKGSTQALHLFVKIPSLQWTFIWTQIGWCEDFLKTLNIMRQTLVGKTIHPKSSTESTAGSSYLTEESGSILLTLLKSLFAFNVLSESHYMVIDHDEEKFPIPIDHVCTIET